MNSSLPICIATALMALIVPRPAAASLAAPGCEKIDAHACVRLAIGAMGGQAALAAVRSARLNVASGAQLVEQSYRQAPFLTTYDRTTETIDFMAKRIRITDSNLWPESDPGLVAAEGSSDIVSSPDGVVLKGAGTDTPGPLFAIDEARERLALGPERVLLTAEAAPDLHFTAPQTVRATRHATVAFRWGGSDVRVLLNPWNHLPDAVETTESFDDFWSAWGDVAQRIYYDNWKLMSGLVYPTTTIVERNSIPWKSAQVLDVAFNVPIARKDFAVNEAAAQISARGKGWDRSFDPSRRTELAPGIELYTGAWNVAIIRQRDGIIIAEAPISPTFAKGAFAQARADYPGLPIKALLTTSDSWPHVAGVRQAVAEGFAVYALDLNGPLLGRLVSAPHTLRPDDLQRHPKLPKWHWVSKRIQIGSGPNRVELVPLRGGDTERQYMVYLPERHLLYASDTLVVTGGGKGIYDPELTREVMQAVADAHLGVERVWAMHQGPVPWSLIEKLMASPRTG